MRSSGRAGRSGFEARRDDDAENRAPRGSAQNGTRRERERERLDRELRRLLLQIEGWLETPMALLGFAWLVLLVVELVWGLSAVLQGAVSVIWGLFVLDFTIRFLVAPQKWNYVKRNWLTALSLVIPALRLFRFVRFIRVLRVARGVRGLRLIKILSSLNRSMRALRRSLGRRGLRYVLALTVVVLILGAAGMWAFEHDLPAGQGFESFGDALWWSAMILTTMGSAYWPVTAEGRILCLILSTYGMAILGYLTASLATFFLGREAQEAAGEMPSRKALDELRLEIAALRGELRESGRQRGEDPLASD